MYQVLFAEDELLVFSLKEEDRGKINELAMEFVYDLVRRQLNEALIVETGEKEFCVFSEKCRKIRRILLTGSTIPWRNFWACVSGCRKAREKKGKIREIFIFG